MNTLPPLSEVALRQAYTALASPVTTPEEHVIAQLAAAAQDGDASAAYRLARKCGEVGQEGLAPLLDQHVLQLTEGIARLLVVRLNSMYNLAVHMYNQDGESNTRCGVALMRMVAEADITAGTGEAINPATVETIPEEAVPLNDLGTTAQYHIGRAFLDGIAVQQDRKIGEAWWLRAARDGKGDREAMYALGLYYSTSYRVDPNDPMEIQPPKYDEAFHWHTKAAASGHVESAAALGIMYQYGTGCKADPETALKWLKAAAEKGSIEAHGHLSHLYYKLHLFNKCWQWAARLDKLELPPTGSTDAAQHASASQSTALGLWILARCYEFGKGVGKDHSEAVRLYNKATSVDKDIVYNLRKRVMQGDLI